MLYVQYNDYQTDVHSLTLLNKEGAQTTKYSIKINYLKLLNSSTGQKFMPWVEYCVIYIIIKNNNQNYKNLKAI